MATPQFADLTTVPTQAQTLSNEVLPQLSANGVNVSSWAIGDPYRAMAMAVAFVRTNVRLALAAMVAAGFEDYVFGRAAAPGGLDVTGWAPLVAQQRYGLKQKLATFTQRNILLTNATGTAYSNLQPGSIILQFPSGNRWFLNQVVTIPANGTVTASFRSEFLNAVGSTYNADPTGSAISFVTSNYPGVTATNTAPLFSAVSQVGSGLGTLTLTGAAGGSHSVTVQITSSGIAGAAGWATSVDGAAFISQGIAPSITNLGGLGINIALADNGGNPSFVAGSYYYFTTPGTDITQVGAAVETPQALGLRVAGLYPLLGFATDAFGNFVPPPSPTQSAYIALALSANANVVGAFIAPTQTINNVVSLYVFGQGGAALPPTVIVSLQTFFNTFAMLTDQVVVSQPAQRAITLALTSGSIQVRTALKASAQLALQQRLAAYLGGTDPVQSLSVNGLIDYDYVTALIRTTPGVTHMPAGALTINGAAADIQLPVTPGAFEVAYWTQQIATAVSWQTV